MQKPNLIFLHAFPFDSTMWEAQTSFFSAKYDVHAIDLRGHGGGPHGPGPWMMSHYADDLKFFMKSKSIEKTILCGLSLGGYVALHFAKKYPQMIEALILCDTRADADSNEAKEKRYENIKKLQGKNLPQFAEDFSKNALAQKTLSEKPEIQKKLVQIITKNHSENLALVLGAIATRDDQTDFVKTIRCPTLIMCGSEDKLTPPDLHKKMYDLISVENKNTELKVIENAGHLSNIEQPGQFNQNIEKFLTAYANI